MCSSPSSSPFNDPGDPELTRRGSHTKRRIQRRESAPTLSPTCPIRLSPLPPLPAQFWFARRSPPFLLPQGRASTFARLLTATPPPPPRFKVERGSLGWIRQRRKQVPACEIRVNPLPQTTSENGNKRTNVRIVIPV